MEEKLTTDLEEDQASVNDASSLSEEVPEVLLEVPPVLREMVDANLFYGRLKSRTHPKMRRYISATRNNVQIIDLTQTMELLEEATKVLSDKVKGRGDILFVGTTPVSKAITRKVATELGMPFVTERWLGGTLTNFQTISKRISYFTQLKEDKASGELERKYTKKEIVGLNRELDKLTIMFEGVEAMKELPAAVFIVGAGSHSITIQEARKLKIPVVAITNTDTNPDLIDYLIPANDRSKVGIDWIMNKVEESLMKAKQERPTPQAEEDAKKEKKEVSTLSTPETI